MILKKRKMGNNTSKSDAAGAGSKSQSILRNGNGATSSSLQIEDRVVWIRENDETKTASIERGTVRWIGTLGDNKDQVMAGVELDNQLGLGSGWYENKQLFTCEVDHGVFISISGLILEKDFIANQDEYMCKIQNGQNKCCKSKDKLSQIRIDSSSSVDDIPAPKLKCTKSNSKVIGTRHLRNPLQGSNSRKKLTQHALQRVEQEVEMVSNKSSREDVNHDCSQDKIVEDPCMDTEMKELGKSSIRSDKSSQNMNYINIGSEKTRRNAMNPNYNNMCSDEGWPTMNYNKIHFERARQNKNYEISAGNSNHQDHNGKIALIGDYHNDGRGEGARVDQRELFNCNEPSSYRASYREGGRNLIKPFNSPSLMPNQPPSLPSTYRNFVFAPVTSEVCPLIDGDLRGIQGYRNSCYIDSALFSIFTFSSELDSFLLKEAVISSSPPTESKSNDSKPNHESHPEGTMSSSPEQTENTKLKKKVRDILCGFIVNPLRKHHYVPARNVVMLRKTLQPLNPGFIGEEMDPQEFLLTLFQHIYKLQDFISYSSGQDDFFHQILVAETENDHTRVPTLQTLLEESLNFQDLKFKKTPNPLLILQMPRSGNDFKSFGAIIPNLQLNITEMLVPTNQNGEEEIKSPSTPTDTNTTKKTDKMDLSAVICIHTNHFVSFVRAGHQMNSPWVFFDSMATREIKNDDEENTPNVKHLPEMGSWLHHLEKDAANTNLTMDHINAIDDNFEYLKRLVDDVYMCFYTPLKT